MTTQQYQRRLHHPLQPSISPLSPSTNGHNHTRSNNTNHTYAPPSTSTPDRPRSVEPQLYLRTHPSHQTHPLQHPTHARRGSNDSRSSSSSGAQHIQRPASTAPTSSTLNGHGRTSSTSSTTATSILRPSNGVSNAAVAPTALRPILTKTVSNSSVTPAPIPRSYARTPVSGSGTLASKQSSTHTPTNNNNNNNDDYKSRIHREARERFNQMVREADLEFQSKLSQVGLGGRSSFGASIGSGNNEAATKLAREHYKSVEELERVIKEEAEERVRREEEKRRRGFGAGLGSVFVEDDADDDVEDEVIWRPDSRSNGNGITSAGGKSLNTSKVPDEVRREQQAILDSIRRDRESNGSGNSGISGGAAIVRPNTSVGYRDAKQQAQVQQQAQAQAQAQGLRRVRWANDLRGVSSTITSNSSSPTSSAGSAPGATGDNNSSGGSATQTQYHQRWIPSVSDYANDMREQQQFGGGRTRTGSFTQSQSLPQVQSPSQSQSQAWTKSAPITIPISTSATSRDKGKGKVVDSGMSNSYTSDTESKFGGGSWRERNTNTTTTTTNGMRRAQTPGPNHTTSISNTVPILVSTPAPKMSYTNSSSNQSQQYHQYSRARSISQTQSNLPVGYQQRLDEMAARLKRELAIST